MDVLLNSQNDLEKNENDESKKLTIITSKDWTDSLQCYYILQISGMREKFGKLSAWPFLLYNNMILTRIITSHRYVI